MVFNLFPHLPNKVVPGSRTRLALLGCCWVFSFSTVIAGSPGTGTKTSSLAEKEMARREALRQEAHAQINEAALQFGQGNYTEAMRLYRQAYDLLPDSPMTADLKRQARDGYSAAAVRQAQKYADEARYAEARALLQSVLAEDFNPDYADAKDFSAKLDDPERYEPALTAEHLDNVKKVSELLQRAYSFYNIGDYDSANATFTEVLRIDAYNSAARRGMEQVELKRAHYLENASRDQMRAKALSEVDKLWEAPVSDVSDLFGSSPVSVGAIGGTRDSVLNKLRSIILPRVELQEASLEEVVQFLRIRSRDLDPDKKGVDFVLKVPQQDRNKPVSLSLTEVPLEEALRYATEATGTVFRLDEFAVIINSLSERDSTIVTKSYRVPPDFIQNAAIDTPSAGASPDPFGQGVNNNQTLKFRRLGAREFFEQRGIEFPEGTTASYNAASNILFVRNTLDNIALIDTIVEQAVSTTPKQVQIQVKMLEVNETRLNELGFDWLLGQFNSPGSDKIFASGGTIGNQRPSGSFTSEDFPIVSGNGPVGQNPVTAGLRSSGAINGVPSIDNLIGRTRVTPIDSRSPGQFAVSGVFTDPQFQMVIRSLSQKKGLDLVAAPNVVTKSGMRSTISVVREFRYPTEFDPPQIPQQIGSDVAYIDGNTGQRIDTGGTFAPITPTTPTSFDKRDVGITLEVEPVVSADNRTVDLNLIPSSTEFEGFIDYGTDIVNRSGDVPYVIDNPILQPVFRNNKVNTSVVVWDGQTVVLGGVMFEKMSEINDKVPFLGDIPVVGRAFKSKVKSVERKNVIFFVTVNVIDPAGNKVLQQQVGGSDPTAAR